MKICRKCQSEFDSRACLNCRKIYIARIRLENPEKLRGYYSKHIALHGEHAKKVKSEWRIKNLAKIKLARIKYYEENKDKVKARAKAWYLANTESAKARIKNYRLINIDWVKQRQRNYRAANADRACVYEQNYRAKKRSNGGELSKDLADKLFKLQRGKCPCCKLPLGDDYHLDHIVPVSAGGSNTDNNIQLLRKQCNLKKWKKSQTEYMQLQGFLL